jgi:eukaryotic-like serine/threonine-protein kinase
MGNFLYSAVVEANAGSPDGLDGAAASLPSARLRLAFLIGLLVLALPTSCAQAWAQEPDPESRRTSGWASIAWLIGAGAISLLGLAVILRRRHLEHWGPQTEGEPHTGADLLGPASGAPPPPGGQPERLGPYLLIDRIGEGGLAEVFTAAGPAPDGTIRPFVIKRLRREQSEDAMAMMHFLAERELGAALVHPNIAAVVDFAEADGQRFLVEEYLAGRDLGRLTRRMVELKQRPLSAAAILYLAHEVLSALDYAHGKRDENGEPLDLVHRDISPENILLSERAEVKLLDFGIAQVRGSSGLGTSGSETVKGNVDFMSPEQAQGFTVDHRADLFSVGLVIYFCAARAPLYRGKTLYDRLLAAASGPQERERDFIAGLPPPLPALLPGFLAINPAERFASAHLAREAIAPHCVGAPPELADAIRRLFGEELLREQARLEMVLAPARSRRPRARPERPARVSTEPS